MSYKSVNNGVSVNEHQWSKSLSIDANVKLAGEESKDRLYEPKHKKKLVRVLTVIAYVFFVSLAAIMLSLYYMFLWNGDIIPKHSKVFKRSELKKCDNAIAEMQHQISAFKPEQATVPAVTTTMDENSTLPEYDNAISNVDDFNESTFIKKLMYYKKYDYGEND